MIPGRTGRSDGSAIVSDRGCSPRLRPCRVPLVLGTGLAPGSGCGALAGSLAPLYDLLKRDIVF